MPRGDGTGPMGQGPMTGFGAGYCTGYEAPDCLSPAYGRGRGWGGGRGRSRGMGRGRGGRWGMVPASSSAPYQVPNAEPNPEAERAFLQNQAQALQAELDNIRRQIDELAGEEKAEG